MMINMLPLDKRKQTNKPPPLSVLLILVKNEESMRILGLQNEFEVYQTKRIWQSHSSLN